MEEAIAPTFYFVPAELRRDIIFASDLQLKGYYAKMERSPKSIKRFPINTAVLLIEFINSPDLLGKVMLVNTRRRPRYAINNHPLYNQIPHKYKCKICATPMTLPANILDIKTMFMEQGLKNYCEVRLIEMLIVANDPELFVDVLQNALNKPSATLEIELAAGRVPERFRELVTTHAPECLDISSYKQSVSYSYKSKACTYITEEPVVTEDLFNLALKYSYMPSHWIITKDMWKQLFVLEPLAGIEKMGLPSFEIIAESWRGMHASYKARAISYVKSTQDIEQLIQLLAPDPALILPTSVVFKLLRLYPDLTSEDRIELLTRIPFKSVCEFLCEDDHLVTRPGEASSILSKFIKNSVEEIIWGNIVAYISQKNIKIITLGQIETVNYILDNAPARTLFKIDSAVAARGYMRLHKELAAPELLTQALSLLKNWSGTLNSLITTVKLL
jgi:hypothetical protein